VLLGSVVPAQVLDGAVGSVANSRLQRARASLSLRPSPLNLIHYPDWFEGCCDLP